MRCFCISDDPDVLTGMRLAGIEGARADLFEGAHWMPFTSEPAMGWPGT